MRHLPRILRRDRWLEVVDTLGALQGLLPALPLAPARADPAPAPEAEDEAVTYHGTLAALRTLVDAQAENEGLWFDARYATEAYLQAALRRLHAAIEHPDRLAALIEEERETGP